MTQATTVPWDSPELRALLQSGQERGCVQDSQLSRAVEDLELDQEQVEALVGRLHDDDVEIRDDCGLPGAPPRR